MGDARPDRRPTDFRSARLAPLHPPTRFSLILHIGEPFTYIQYMTYWKISYVLTRRSELSTVPPLLGGSTPQRPHNSGLIGSFRAQVSTVIELRRPHQAAARAHAPRSRRSIDPR